MKHPVHPCDEIRGVGPHHTRVEFDALENIGDARQGHPVKTIEPDPIMEKELIREALVQVIMRLQTLSPNQLLTVFLRYRGMEWRDIAVRLNMDSPQAAEYTLTTAIRKIGDIRSLFPKTDKNNTRKGRHER